MGKILKVDRFKEYMEKQLSLEKREIGLKEKKEKLIKFKAGLALYFNHEDWPEDKYFFNYLKALVEKNNNFIIKAVYLLAILFERREILVHV